MSVQANHDPWVHVRQLPQVRTTTNDDTTAINAIPRALESYPSAADQTLAADRDARADRALQCHRHRRVRPGDSPHVRGVGWRAIIAIVVSTAAYFMDPEEPCEHVDFDIRKRRQHLIDHARERLHAQLAQEPTTWCEIEEVVAIDRAYKAVLKQATASSADLIVMGAQGTSGVELMLYGSNTQHVLRAASCPVLTVHV